MIHTGFGWSISTDEAYFNACRQNAELRAEIERLRTEALQAEQNWAADWKHEFDKLRNDIIEECAKVVDDADDSWLAKKLASAIRALKSDASS